MNQAHMATVSLPALPPLRVLVKTAEAYPEPPSYENQLYSHSHAECEVYFNLSGNVAFAVENRVYPVSMGSIILTRPNEFHHCIHRDGSRHRHICLFINAREDHPLFRRFYQRPAGEGNLVQLHGADIARFETICVDLSRGTEEPAQTYALFLELMALINNGSSPEEETAGRMMPDDVQAALRYIAATLPEKIRVADLADAAHESVNSIERHFSDTMGISPLAYIAKRRLLLAQDLLLNGANVQEAAARSGFPSDSYFVSVFRQNMGMTPFAFKKQNRK